ncbi:MBOAT family protein [Lachnospiraceae bacterium ZAX-1]
MLFSSIVFLAYFLPCVLVAYHLCRFLRPIQNLILLLFSLLFYAWGEPWFVFVMIASITVNYVFGRLVDHFRERRIAIRIIMTSMVAFNLGILFVFKYLTFVLRNIWAISGNWVEAPKIVLPIGISFFTFQAMSYVIDVYRKDANVQKNPLYFGLYIAFFPQLIAGPIVAYHVIEDQIRKRTDSLRKVSIGVCRFVSGLGKKVLIANSMATVADHIFTMCEKGAISAPLAWLGSIAYTLQIFFDFSGYSDMAIGLGLMFGFKFQENFNYPYISQSMTEFWRRWHISLAQWFRNYVYIPLGGSKGNADKTIRNMFIVWVLTGIWHGAEWTFVIWGVYNFVFIFIERLLKIKDRKGYSVWRHIYTLLAVNFGMVIFRATTHIEAGKYLGSMFGIGNGDTRWQDGYTWMFLKENAVFFIAAVLFSTPIARRVNKVLTDGRRLGFVLDGCYPVAILLVFVICITYMVKGTYNPFVYFNF